MASQPTQNRGDCGEIETFREESQEAGTGGFIEKGARDRLHEGSSWGCAEERGTLADGRRQGGSMDEQAGGSGPSAKLLQALPALVFLLPVKAVLCLVHDGVKRWARKPSPEPCFCLQGASPQAPAGLPSALEAQPHLESSQPLPVFGTEFV